MKQYFVDARVGDSVYDMAYGKGRITRTITDTLYPIGVCLENGHMHYYTLDGVYIGCGKNQTLFYSKPIFELPPPPKREVRKVIEGWINIYPSSSTQWTSTIHKTEALADEAVLNDRLGKAHPIYHEYWVEE